MRHKKRTGYPYLLQEQSLLASLGQPSFVKCIFWGNLVQMDNDRNSGAQDIGRAAISEVKNNVRMAFLEPCGRMRILCWRRGWDSNPRGASRRQDDFESPPLRPLRYPSARDKDIIIRHPAGRQCANFVITLQRRFRKKSFKSQEHSSARMSETISARWLSLGSEAMLYRVVTAPALGSAAP